MHIFIPSCAWILSNNKDGEIRTRDHSDIKVLISCQRINSTQKLKILDEVPIYDLYHSLIYHFKWKPFEFKTCTCIYYFLFNFYQINKNNEIQTSDRLIIKVLIPCQRIILIKKINLLIKILRYSLYYSWREVTLSICFREEKKNCTSYNSHNIFLLYIHLFFTC